MRSRRVGLSAAQLYLPSPSVKYIVAENRANRGIKDELEDAAFRFLLKEKDDEWWERWAANNMQMAEAAEEPHLISNKWPVELIATGLVVSIGPAQITPRTALRACQALRDKPICEGGAKSLVSQMLDAVASIKVAAAVLRFEANEEMRLTGKDVSDDFAVWATIYNVGGECPPSALMRQIGWVEEGRISGSS